MPDTTEYDRRKRMAQLSAGVEQSASNLATSSEYDQDFETGSPVIRSPIQQRAVGPQPAGAIQAQQPVNSGQPVTIPGQYRGENRQVILDTLGASNVTPANRSLRGGVAGTWDRIRANTSMLASRAGTWFSNW